MQGLKNKRALITGGASGIGAATALRFLGEGARVVVLDRDEALLKTFEDQHPELSGAILADASEPSAVDESFVTLGALMGGWMCSSTTRASACAMPSWISRLKNGAL